MRGILAIAPAAALTAIALVFGAYALVDGIMLVGYAIGTRKSIKGWGWVLAQGILSVLVGLGALGALGLPGLVGALGGPVVLWTIVFWNVMTGIVSIQAATKEEAGRAKTWTIVVSLVLAVILAIVTLLTRGATLLGLIWAVGIYAIVLGSMLIVTAIHVRRLGRELLKPEPPLRCSTLAARSAFRRAFSS